MFFERTKNDELIFQTDLWNNLKVVGLTGYSITMILDPLYKLAKFIRENLTPDRLEGFDLEGILTVKHFENQSKNVALTYQ